MILILFWLVFGALAGWIASMLEDYQNNAATIKYIGYGIIGAIGGGSLFSLFDQTTDFPVTLSAVFFPILGSVMSILLIKRFNNQSG